MSVSNHHLDELIECGYTIVEGFLTPEELKDAQDLPCGRSFLIQRDIL